jgi:putative transposase
VSDRVVWRIWRDHEWWSVFGKPKRSKGSKPGTPSHDDLVKRDFTAVAPNQLWLSDLTEHWTRKGKLYVCAIKDVFSNRIVGWAIDENMKARLVVAAIEMAVAGRGDVVGCILHSDRGSQFRARKVHWVLARHGMVGFMGKARSAGGNAAMESFVALLNKNVLNRRSWASCDDLRIEIITWIERTYHRRQTRLGRLTPMEYETIMTPHTAPAA